MEKKIFTLKLTEEQTKWVRIALDTNGDIQDEAGRKNRAEFLYKLAEKLRMNKWFTWKIGRDSLVSYNNIKSKKWESYIYKIN